MTPEALYVIAVWILTGMGFGMLATGYGACRKTYHVYSGLREFLDWFWFMLAAAAFLVVIFWTEWGTLRIWSVAFVLVGYGLWSWLAAPMVLPALIWVTGGQARLVYYSLLPGKWLRRTVVRVVTKRRKPPKKE